MFITDSINDTLSYDPIKMFLILLSGVYAGYTLQPVPEVLNTLFNESVWFKYAILFTISALTLHPLDDKKLAISIVAPGLILYLFSVLRS